METKLLDKQAVSAKFAVTISQNEVDQTYERVLRSLSKQIRVPGFRPGKAPKGVIVKRIGQDSLDHEVRDFLVEQHYPKAVQELELTPVHANFDADDPSEGSDYTFEVEVDLYPDFELPDLNEVVIDTVAPPLTGEMLAEAVEDLRGEYAVQVPVDRAAEDGDMLMVELVPAEGAPEDEQPGQMPIDLEKTTDNLKEQLIGKNIGDEVELVLEGPGAPEADAGTGDDEEGEDAHKEAADAAEPTKVNIIIRDIKAKEKPEADDELAKTLGMEDWAAVEERLRDSLQQQLDSDAFTEQREEFIEKLVAEVDFELPKSIVNRRKASTLQSFMQDLSRQGTTLDAHIEENDDYADREAFDQELQGTAEIAVRRDLVLEQLLEKRGTTMSDQEFDSAISYMAMQHGSDPAKFRRERGETWLENYRFLLTRDKAVREVVRELLGLDEKEKAAAEARAERESEKAKRSKESADTDAQAGEKAELEEQSTDADTPEVDTPEADEPESTEADAEGDGEEKA